MIKYNKQINHTSKYSSNVSGAISLIFIFSALLALGLVSSNNSIAYATQNSSINENVLEKTTPSDINTNADENSDTSNGLQEGDNLSTTTRNLRERIERIVEEKRDQIKGVISEIDSKRRSTIGEIQRISEDSLTISGQGGTEIIPLSNTRYNVSLLKDGEPTTTSDIAVGNWILALGVIEEDSFQPVRVLISETTLRPRTRVVAIGTITSSSRNSLEIEQRSQGESITFTLNSNTQFQDIQGNEISVNEIDTSMQAVVAGIVTSDSSQTTQNQTNTETSTTRTALKVKLLTTIEE